jgi:hypothetical protein
MEGTKQSFLFQFIMNDRIIPRWIYTECPNSNPHPKVDFARIIATNQEYYKNDIKKKCRCHWRHFKLNVIAIL